MSRVRVTLWQNDDVALAKRLAEIRRNARSILIVEYRAFCLVVFDI